MHAWRVTHTRPDLGKLEPFSHTLIAHYSVNTGRVPGVRYPVDKAHPKLQVGMCLRRVFASCNLLTPRSFPRNQTRQLVP